MAVWINRPTASIPKSAAEEITVLIENADRLDELFSGTQTQAHAVRPAEIIQKISKASGVDAEELRKIFNALENLKGLSDEFGGIPAAIDSLFGNLRGEILNKLKEKKSKIIEAVEKYSADNAVTIAYKAQKLTYQRENIYQEAEIITEVRPVYDQKAETIFEYLVTHSLIATYFRNGRFENIHLAMDMADVLKLRRVCDRAILKAKTLRDELGEKARVLRDDDDNP
jgi:hypothetical protein